MASYNTVITNEGAALLASVIANQGTLTFSEMRFSTTDYDGVEQTLTVGTFGGVFITTAASGSVVDATTIKVAAQFDNSGIVGDHPLYSIGIVGTDGNTTALIAVCTTTNPDIIRAALTGVSTYAFNMNLTVSSTNNITVVGTTAGVQYENLSNPITIDGNVETTVESALDALNTYSDKIKDNLTGRNLLDNGWFTVNQRGATGGTIVAHTPIVDRWKVDLGAGSPTWALTSSGITLNPDTNSYAYIYQQLADGSALVGKQLTVSVKLSNGTVLSTSFTRTSGTNQFETKDNVRMGINAGDRVAIYAMDGVSKTIRAVKLELGTVSTLALDVEPDPTTELLKCQRYFYRFKANTANAWVCIGVTSGTAKFNGIINLPVPMRSTPTATYSGGLDVQEYGSGVVGHLSAVAWVFRIDGIVGIEVTVAETFNGGKPALLYMPSNASYIDFSADL